MQGAGDAGLLGHSDTTFMFAIANGACKAGVVAFLNGEEIRIKITDEHDDDNDEEDDDKRKGVTDKTSGDKDGHDVKDAGKTRDKDVTVANTCHNPACACSGEGRAGSPGARLLRCGRCQAAHYCGQECQKRDCTRIMHARALG